MAKDDKVELALMDFGNDLTDLNSIIIKKARPGSNISAQDSTTIHTLNQSPKIKVVNTDKGLGPATMNNTDYYHHVYNTSQRRFQIPPPNERG